MDEAIFADDAYKVREGYISSSTKFPDKVAITNSFNGTSSSTRSLHRINAARRIRTIYGLDSIQRHMFTLLNARGGLGKVKC